MSPATPTVAISPHFAAQINLPFISVFHLWTYIDRPPRPSMTDKFTDQWVLIKSAAGGTWREEFGEAQSKFVREVVHEVASWISRTGGTVHASRISNGLNYHTPSGTHVRIAFLFYNAGSKPYFEIVRERDPKGVKTKVITDMTAKQIGDWIWKKLPAAWKS